MHATSGAPSSSIGSTGNTRISGHSSIAASEAMQTPSHTGRDDRAIRRAIATAAIARISWTMNGTSRPGMDTHPTDQHGPRLPYFTSLGASGGVRGSADGPMYPVESTTSSYHTVFSRVDLCM